MTDANVTATDQKPWAIAATGNPVKSIPGGKLAEWHFSVVSPQDAALTRPYFTRPNEEQPYYDLIDPRYRNLPFGPYPLVAHAKLGVPWSPV